MKHPTLNPNYFESFKFNYFESFKFLTWSLWGKTQRRQTAVFLVHVCIYPFPFIDSFLSFFLPHSHMRRTRPPVHPSTRRIHRRGASFRSSPAAAR